MAEHGVLNKNEDIAEVVLPIIINNIKDFKRFTSKVFFVRGNPWRITIHKLVPKINVMNEDSLIIDMESNIPDKSDDWMIIANCTANLLPISFNKTPIEVSYSGVFNSKLLRHRLKALITWNELINPVNGFIKNDAFKLEIKVKSAPKQDSTKENELIFKIQRLCEDCLAGKYRITVKNITDLTGAASNNFTMKYFSWRLLIYRHGVNLCIQLYSRCTDPSVSYRACLKSKLISFDQLVVPKQPKTVNIECNSSLSKSDFIMLIPLNELFDPQNSYVLDDSISIEFEMNLEKIEQNLAKKRKALSGNNLVDKMACVICFEDLNDRPTSSIACGHVFCTQCIQNSLQKKAICPICNQKATVDEIRKVFLPL